MTACSRYLVQLAAACTLAVLALASGAAAAPAGRATAGGAAAQPAGATASINGRIVFDSSRPPGDIGSHLIYSVAADGSDLQGPLTATDVPASDLDSGEATFSPDGTKVAYYTKNFAGGGGDLPCCGEIAVMNPDGTDRQLLINGHGTTGCGFNDQPAWSPDGREIAFVTCSAPDGHTAIGVVNADGSGFHFLLTTTNFNAIYHPSWSPDGTTIAYTHLDNGEVPHIVTISATGGGSETELGLGFDPAWSPDGTKIAFDHPTGENDTGIWVMNPDGSGAVQLTHVEDARPAWSPDGTRIAFESRRDGNGWQIYTMNADGSNQTPITNAPGVNNEWPTWGRSQDVVVTDCTDPALAQLTSVTGSLVISGLADCTGIDLGHLVSVDGDLIIDEPGVAAGAVNLGSISTVGGDLTVSLGSPGEATGSVNIGSETTVGGNLTVSLGTPGEPTGSVNLGSDTVGGDLTISLGEPGEPTGSVNLGSDTTVGGNLTVSLGSPGEPTGTVNLGSDTVGGDLTVIADGSDSVAAATADGTTDLSILGGTAAMHVAIPSGAFDQPVQFTVTRQDGSAPAPGTDASGQPAVVQPVAAYAFSFAVPTLNSDAQLSFTVDLAQLDDATRAALLAGAQDGTATIAVKRDTAGSPYQAFARCGSGQSPATDGCVDVSLLDAAGDVVTDAADAASVQFDGVAGHFSSYAVAIVTPAHSTPPAINGSGSGGGGGGTSGGSGSVTDKTPPVLSKLSAKPSVVRLARAHHKARSATLHFSVSESSLVTFTAELVLPGRRSGKHCVAGRGHGKACTVYKKLAGALRVDATAGQDTVTFSGRLAGRRLKPGRYRLTAIAIDAAGNTSNPARVTITVR